MSSHQPNSTSESPSLQQRLALNQGDAIAQSGSVQYHDAVNQSHNLSTTVQETDTISLNQTLIRQDVNLERNEQGFPVMNLKILGIVQIVISGISCFVNVICQTIDAGKDTASNFDVGLFPTTFCLSIWFLFTGCIPLCISRQRRNDWKYLKVIFMVCSILGSFLLAIQGGTVIKCIEGLRYTTDKSTKALTIIIAVILLSEAVVAIVSAFYCCFTAWNSSFPAQQGLSPSTTDGTHEGIPVKGLRIFGLVQMVSGVISCTLSIIGIIDNRNESNFVLQFYNKCLILSVWFYLTGCIPICTFGQSRNNRTHLKVLFMTCNVLGIISCVVIWPLEFLVLVYLYRTAFAWVTASIVILDLIVAVVSIFFCCCTDWDTTNQQNIYTTTTFTSSNSRYPDMRNQPAVLSQQANSTIESPSLQHRLALNQGDTTVQGGSVPYHGAVHQNDTLSTTAQGTTDTISLNLTSITQDLAPEGNARGFPVRNLKILGLVQIVISGISCYVGVVGKIIEAGKDAASNFDDDLLPTTFFLSIWFLFTGCIPLGISRQRRSNWKYLKVKFMVCSILGSFVFAIQGGAIIKCIEGLRYTTDKSTKALTIIIAVILLSEAVVAIVSAFYCNVTAWNSSFPAQQGLSSSTTDNGTNEGIPVRGLRIFGILQIVSGVISCTLSGIGISVDRNKSNFALQFYNKCLILSVWFLLTGCIPMGTFGQRQNNRTRLKVVFMACNVLGIISCVVIWPSEFQVLVHLYKTAFAWVTASKVILDLIVAVISIFFCCCTDWVTTNQQNIYTTNTLTGSNGRCSNMRNQPAVSSQQSNSTIRSGSPSPQHRLALNQGDATVQRGSVPYHGALHQSDTLSTTDQESTDTMSLNPTSIIQDLNPEGNERGFPVRNLKILGLVQIVISIISCLLSLGVLIIYTTEYWSGGFNLFLTTLFLSVWFLLTGCIPLCISRQRRNNWKYLKVSFMSCSILGGFAFVIQSDTIMESIEVLHYTTDKGTKALTIIIAVILLSEAVVAIVSAFYCTLSAWNSSFPAQQGLSSDTTVRIFGLVQIVSGGISCILGIVGIYIERHDIERGFPYIEYLILSVWFILTGCIPLRISRQRRFNWIYWKISFMACNVLGVMACVVICSFELQFLDVKYVKVFNLITVGKVILDLVVAVISIFYCCCTDWDTTIQQDNNLLTFGNIQETTDTTSPNPTSITQDLNPEGNERGFPVSNLKILGVIQIGISGFSCFLSLIGITSVSIATKDRQNRTFALYLFSTTFFYSIWFLLTGCFPMRISRQWRNNWSYLTVSFMLCSILGGFVFVIQSTTVIGLIVDYNVGNTGTKMLAIIITILVFWETVVAIASALYCCFTVSIQQELSSDTTDKVTNNRMFPVNGLQILGLVQIVSGGISYILSGIGIFNKRHDIERGFPYIEYLILSVWFILTGCISIHISRQKRFNWTYLKVICMACNVLGGMANVFICPFFQFLEGYSFTVFTWITAGKKLVDMIVAVTTIFFCCYTEWDTITQQVGSVGVNESSSIYNDTRVIDGSINSSTQDQLQYGDREGEADEDDTEDASPLLKGATGK